MMDAVLLAGGFGTRLRPLTYTRPKPLLNVAGRPMVEWVLDRLPKEVHRVIVTVNWRAQDLGAYFAKSSRPLDFVVVREEEPLGTGGAVKNCAPHIASDRFLVLNADIVSDMDLAALATSHRAHGGEATISLKEVEADQVVHYGVARPGAPDADGSVAVEGFVEKPRDPAAAPSRLINAGAYLMQRSVLDLIPPGKMVSMEKEIFPQLLGRGFRGLPFAGAWLDVGDPERLRAASRHLDPASALGRDTRLAAGAKVTSSVVGSRCYVGPGAEVEECVLGDGVTVAAGVRLLQCVVGDGEMVRSSQTGARIWSRPVPAGYPEKQVGNALA
ncbi:MAG: sugar phosphate nucleotidyltransferase [Thermoplasmatota archaeon]